MARTFTLYETGKITEEEFVKRRSELLELQTNIRQTIFDKNTELQKLRERQINRETFKRVLAILRDQDRKSTRLNSSHSQISYAVFCLKKKKKNKKKILVIPKNKK